MKLQAVIGLVDHPVHRSHGNPDHVEIDAIGVEAVINSLWVAQPSRDQRASPPSRRAKLRVSD